MLAQLQVPPLGITLTFCGSPQLTVLFASPHETLRPSHELSPAQFTLHCPDPHCTLALSQTLSLGQFTSHA